MSGSDKDKPGPKGAEAIEEIKARLGGLSGSLDSALGAISNIVKAAENAAEGAEQTSTYESPDGKIKATSGLRVRVGGLAAGAGSAGSSSTSAGSTSSTSETPKAPEADPPREPMVDIYDEADAWVLTAELPGVEQDQLSLHVTDGELVFATLGARRFRYATPLPANVDPAGASHALRNGILEVRLPKQPDADHPQGDADGE